MNNKPKFKNGQQLYWNSKKQNKRIEGKLLKTEYWSFGNQCTLDCGTDGRWEVPEKKLKTV